MSPSIPREIRNRHGERLDFAYHPGGNDDSRLVVIGHGVTGFKDRPVPVALATALAESGIHALRFTFSGNAGSEGRFEDATVTKEMDDLGAVLDALSGWHLGYAGHSMGAAVGVLRASDDPRIRFLVSIAGMVHTEAFAQRHFGDLTPGQELMWDKPECVLSAAWWNDMATIKSVLPLAARVSVPWMLVHGLADDVVSVQDSIDIFAAANQPKTLITIPDADHLFSGEPSEAMAAAIVAWVKDLAGPERR